MVSRYDADDPKEDEAMDGSESSSEVEGSENACGWYVGDSDDGRFMI